MQVMNERVFLAFRGLAVHRSRLWLASQAQAQVKGTLPHAFCACLSIRSWLSAGPTSPGKRPYSFYAEITADLPHMRRLLHSPRHLPLAYSEVTQPGLLTGPPPLSTQDVPPEWVYRACVPSPCCTTIQIYVRFTRSPVSVSSLLETFSGPAQDCSMLLNRGGFGRGVGSPSPQGNLCNPRSLSPELLDVIEQGGNLGAGLRALVTPAKDSTKERPKCLNSPPHSRRCTSLEPPR